MKKEVINKIILITLLISICLVMTACNTKHKDIILKLEDEHKKENKNISITSKQKDIVVSNDVKKDIGEYEKKKLSIIKNKNLAIYDEELEPTCWKDEENFIAIKRKGDINNSYDIYNINVSNSKVTKIHTLKNAAWRTETTAEQSKKILYLKDLKIYIYDLVNNTSKQVFDVSNIKKEFENEYEGYYIKEWSNGMDDVIYEIEKRKNNNDPKFNIKKDIEFVKIFDINLVKGSNNYISIISRRGYSNEEFIRILNVDTGKVVRSEPIKNLKIDMSNQSGFIYNKSKDVFFVRGNFSSIYEYKLNTPGELRELKEISELKFGSSNNVNDEKNLYFIAGDSEKASIVKYDLADDKITVLQKDMPNGVYHDIKINSKTNLINYSYYKQPFNNYNDETYTFIGVIDGDRIKNIQKLPVEKLYEKYHNMNSVIFNENGNKFIYKVSYNYEKNDIKYRGAKYYYYEVVK